MNYTDQFKELGVLVDSIFGGSEKGKLWWNTPNKAFDNFTPMDIWLKDPDKIECYINSKYFGEW